MLIDDALVSYLEALSCLSISGDERIRLISDLQKIIDYMAKLAELDTGGARDNPLANTNVFRDDAACPSLDRELILKNAPVKNDAMIIAPGIMA